METEDIQALERQSIGDGACVYRYGIDVEDVHASLWIYEFHYTHWVMVTTGAAVEAAF